MRMRRITGHANLIELDRSSGGGPSGGRAVSNPLSPPARRAKANKTRAHATRNPIIVAHVCALGLNARAPALPAAVAHACVINLTHTARTAPTRTCIPAGCLAGGRYGSLNRARGQNHTAAGSV